MTWKIMLVAASIHWVVAVNVLLVLYYHFVHICQLDQLNYVNPTLSLSLSHTHERKRVSRNEINSLLKKREDTDKCFSSDAMNVLSFPHRRTHSIRLIFYRSIQVVRKKNISIYCAAMRIMHCYWL